MADDKGGRSERSGVLRNPGSHRLTQELEAYLEARLDKALTGVGHRMGAAAARLGTAPMGPRALTHALGRSGRKLAERASPGATALTSAASHVADTATHAKDTASHAKDAVVDKVKEATGRTPDAHHAAPDGGRRTMTVIEDIDVGVPVREAYDQWTQFQEFSRFAKGVVDVEQEDDTTTRWEVKIAKATRAFQGHITEQVPDERIAWTSEGAKGTTKGVVTFHPLGENLTKVLLVMEYFPKGIVEKAGSLVRAQGRRARLDLKAFRTFVMLRGEATGGWRGEIHGGEVVRGPDEGGDRSGEEARGGRDETPDGEEYEDEEFEDDEEAEDRDADDAYEEEDEDEYEEDREDEDEPGDRYEDRDEGYAGGGEDDGKPPRRRAARKR
ncbi:SRPBCC family protein [Streptomyces coeruleoprunus]|uniref:SRPBCC family protein n=1 Tax=Streptomyces coeruleoprunus TaxID=285563 RepID=A0ABV9X7H8_9ACTN